MFGHTAEAKKLQALSLAEKSRSVTPEPQSGPGKMPASPAPPQTPPSPAVQPGSKHLKFSCWPGLCLKMYLNDPSCSDFDMPYVQLRYSEPYCTLAKVSRVR